MLGTARNHKTASVLRGLDKTKLSLMTNESEITESNNHFREAWHLFTRSANSSVDKIPEHEKIRREKENSKQNPACVAFAVKRDTHTENNGARL